MPLSYTVVGPVTKKVVKPPTQPPGNPGGGRKPAKPTNLTATADGVDIALAWTDNATTETDYIVQRSLTNNNNGFSTIATIAADSTSYDDEGLDPETTYYYRVAAVRNNRRSSWSNKANDTTGLGIEVPVLEAYQRSDSAGSAVNPFVMTAPSGITAGELLLLIVNFSSSSIIDGIKLTAPAGFTALGEISVASQCKSVVFYKIATGSEGDQSIANTSNNWFVGWYLRISGADPDEPIHSIKSRWSAAATSAVIPHITTNVDNCLGIYGISKTYGSPNAFGAPDNGWAELDDHYTGTSGSGFYVSAAFGSKDLESQGDSGDITVSIPSNDESYYFQMAINPAGFVRDTISPVIEDFRESNSGGSSTNNLNFLAPPGIQAGELLFLAVATDDSGGGGQRINTPAGWTFIKEHGDTATDCHLAFFYKVATGSEGTVNVTQVSSSYRMCGMYLRISGADTADPINYSQSAGFVGSDAYVAMPNPGISTDEDNCLILAGFAQDSGDRGPYGVNGDRWFKVGESISGTGFSSAGMGLNYMRGMLAGPVNEAILWAEDGEDKVFVHCGINPA